MDDGGIERGEDGWMEWEVEGKKIDGWGGSLPLKRSGVPAAVNVLPFMSWDRARQRHGDTSQIFLFFFCQVSFKEKNLAHTKVERRLWRMESISLPPPHDAGGKKKCTSFLFLPSSPCTLSTSVRGAVTFLSHVLHQQRQFFFFFLHRFSVGHLMYLRSESGRERCFMAFHSLVGM